MNCIFYSILLLYYSQPQHYFAPKRIRANRRGSQLLTRVLSLSYKTGLPTGHAPSTPVQDGLTIRHSHLSVTDLGCRPIMPDANAIESLNSVVRKATRNRKVFPNNQSALNVVYLATKEASTKWTIPIKNWKSALNAVKYRIW